MNIIVVHNQKARGAGKFDALQDAFKKHKLYPEYIAIHDATARQVLKTAAAKHGAVLVAAGGDGTVQFVAGVAREAKAILAVVPLGTLNHFAKDLHIPLEIPAAVAAIKARKTTTIDTGDVNGQIFINNSSIGLYPQSLRARKKYRHVVGNIPAAIISMAKVLVRPRRYRVTLHVDGKRITRRTPFVFIGNNAYTVRGNQFFNRKSLTEGHLAVYIVKASKPWHVARLFFTALFTKKRRTADLDIYYTDSCIIKNRHRHLPVAFDGEVGDLKTPLAYKIRPKSLNVIIK